MKTLKLLAVLAVAAACLGTMVFAQKNSVQPQPRADALPPIGVAAPSRGTLIPKPEGVMPTVPAGFTVTVLAEIESPRLMVYAPNGDLFVSSPAANNITVFRDANNDGVFETRSVYAQAENPPRGGGPRGGTTPT